jgi:hypothetical protein
MLLLKVVFYRKIFSGEFNVAFKKKDNCNKSENYDKTLKSSDVNAECLRAQKKHQSDLADSSYKEKKTR